MGYRRNWDSSSWSYFKTQRNINSNSKSTQMFNQGAAKSDKLPFKCTRESRDSIDHPNSKAFIFGIDFTGSMSYVLETAMKGLNTTVVEIFDRFKTCDPQIMIAGIDDYASTRYSGFDHCPPLQWTQFENDIKIAIQMSELKETHCGAGNGYESYPLLWYAASRHTSIDCYEKRGEKGILITVGDDGLPDRLTKEEIKAVFGDDIFEDISVASLFREVSKKYEVYHIMLEDGGSHSRNVEHSWRNIVGERALLLDKTEKLPELLVSICQAAVGTSVNDIVDSWDGSTKLSVQKALSGLSVKTEKNNGLVRF